MQIDNFLLVSLVNSLNELSNPTNYHIVKILRAIRMYSAIPHMYMATIIDAYYSTNNHYSKCFPFIKLII